MSLRRGRGVGVRGLKNKQKLQERSQQKGQEIQNAKISEMKSQLKDFRSHLEEFARKHKKEINKDPAFRAQFNQMCQSIGVDPLASNKGFWADILGVGDFYYELSVQMIDVCLQTRNVNGGLIEINELRTRIQNRRSSKSSAISNDDIKRAMDKVKSLGNGFGLIVLNNREMVKSVPIELNRDHSAILNICNNTACTTMTQLRRKLNWPIYRIEETLDLMLQEGVCWTDEQTPNNEIVYWFPSLWKQNK